jgi:hypothetical protein
MTEPGTNRAAGGVSTTDHDSSRARDPELIAEEWAERAGRWLMRGMARAKEEAEDIWADAQALRREL